MKFEAIYMFRNEFPVRRMCRILGVYKSSYYRWVKAEKRRRERELEEMELVREIERIFEESDRTYGYRPIRAELAEGGMEVSEYMVRKIMKENGFYPQTQSKYRPAGKGKSDGRYSENILDRDFDVREPGKVLAGDITYIKTGIGWVYLAVVTDLFNREVIGYALSRKIDCELVKRALSNALVGKSREETEGMIFHSDRGCQYSSRTYQCMLRDNGMVSSMSRPGCPYDNSCVESFFATLKKERIYRRKYNDLDDVRSDVFRYIELFYNRKRRHSRLGYVSPVRYRMDYEERKKCTEVL